MPQFYVAETIHWLKEDWHCNAIRAALAVSPHGYLENPEREWLKMETVIEAAIAADIYIVIDWHAHEMETPSACEFFDRLSCTFGNLPNLIYEIWNEPHPKYGWSGDIKPYSADVIRTIRANAPDNLIVVGTPCYSQHADLASHDPLEFENVAYSVHFYAASHRAALRARCTVALERDIPLLVTEYGTCESTGDGLFDPEETRNWWRFLEHNKIGHFNWSIADKLETASALVPGTPPKGGWTSRSLTRSGHLVREYLRSKALDS